MLTMEDYLRQYGLVLMLTAAAVLIPSSVLVISQLSTKIRARPFRPNPLKNAPYECGMEAERGRWERFNVRYYRFALLFLLFDVEVVFPSSRGRHRLARWGGPLSGRFSSLPGRWLQAGRTSGSGAVWNGTKRCPGQWRRKQLTQTPWSVRRHSRFLCALSLTV